MLTATPLLISDHKAIKLAVARDMATDHLSHYFRGERYETAIVQYAMVHDSFDGEEWSYPVVKSVQMAGHLFNDFEHGPLCEWFEEYFHDELQKG